MRFLGFDLRLPPPLSSSCSLSPSPRHRTRCPKAAAAAAAAKGVVRKTAVRPAVEAAEYVVVAYYHYRYFPLFTLHRLCTYIYCIHIHTYTCIYVYIHTYIYIYIYIYVCMYKH